MAWIITLNGKPATIGDIAKIDRCLYSHHTQENMEIVCAISKPRAIERYLYNLGYTWAERPKGVEVMKVALCK